MQSSRFAGSHLTGISRRALVLALVLACPAFGQTRVLRIETIKSEPFGYESAAGPGGMMYEIGNLIAERAGLPSRTKVVPYARTVVSLREGEADMVLRFSNDELTQVAHQVAPVLSLPTMVVGTSRAHIRTLADLAGANVAVSRSFPMDSHLAAVRGIKFQQVDSNEKAVRMLRAGRVDAIYGSSLGIFGAAQKQGVGSGEFSKPILLEGQHFWLHLSRKTATPELVEALRSGVEAAKRDGSIAKIWRRYSGVLNDDGASAQTVPLLR